MWNVQVLIQGYPGKSRQQGGLGWSTVALARGPENRLVLLDTSRLGARRLLLDKFKALGITPDDITDVLITHLHYDHSENWPMFTQATVHAPAAEMDYALAQPIGAPLWPEYALRALAESPRFHRLVEGPTGLPGISCFEAPGHSPHHLAFVLEGEPRVIFSADIAKNRAELATGKADMTMDAAVHARSIARLNAAWRERPGTLLLPGHDQPLVLDGSGQPVAQGKRETTVEAWFGASLDDRSVFDVTESGVR
ncbi:MBL fold metallo-hydrolase [Muricoccus radiodurans]|uniref:MBL fold metallo-hydrolase n=1 Tax=Muricoccus radiodurans TaxID=2231721 RepID=UPI003CF719E2